MPDTTMSPNCSRRRYALSASGERKYCTTRDPSSGGIGIRLKIARSTFTKIPTVRTSIPREAGARSPVWMHTESSAERRKAIRMLVSGPAAPTRAQSRRGFRRRETSTGTGFAPPKMNPDPERIRNAGNRIVKNGSMW
jgi:hypothetical protein